MNKEWL